MIDLLVAAAAVGFWFLAYGICRLLTRPASPAAAPATMDLGPESPALVSLLVNRWTPTEDAAESTLLDLAARRHVELRQPGDDPMQTTVHLPARPPGDDGLKPYEQQVLDRIRGLAVGGVVPIAALTFRDTGQSGAWNRRLRQAVIAEARAAGLSRRRISKTVSTLLAVLAGGAGLVVGLVAMHYGAGRADDDKPPALAFGLFTFAALAVLGGRSLGERDTAAGRAVASRWLGVRDWLRGHEQFAELPPAAVMIWDRYLAYGAAVGVTRLASAVLDLEMGDRKLVWSSFGGTWHRVRVRYPRFWPRYGRTVPHLLFRAVIYLVVGGAALRAVGRDDKLALLPLAVLLLGAYVLVRTLLDLALVRTVTGEVLWVDTWKSRSQGEDNPSVPWLDHLAIDDGTRDRTVAWGLPSGWRAQVHDGDTVTITVRPWSRRVTSVQPVGHGRSRALVETVTSERTGELTLEVMPSAAPAAAVFSTEDIARVVGRPVAEEPLPLGRQYRSAGPDRKPLLLVQAVSGLPGRVAWRANSRGQEAGGAFYDGDRAAFRRGDTTYVLTLLGDGRAGRGHLPWLIGRAVG